MQTLHDVIRKIAKKGWRVHFEGFGSDILYFTITTPPSSRLRSHISGAVSHNEMESCRIDVLTLRLDKAIDDLER